MYREGTASILVSVIVVAFLAFVPVAALYGENLGVIELNRWNFDNEVMKSEYTYVVKFYAPWCGHCRSFVPEFEKAAKNLKNLVKVGAMDCDDQNNKAICATYGVQGFPTIKIFYTKQRDRKRIWTDYQSARTAVALANAATSRIPSFVKPISSAQDINPKKYLSIERFYNLKNDTLPKVILFSNKTSVSNKYKALAIDFHYRLVLGSVVYSKENEMLVKDFGVKTVPTLMVVDVIKEGETTGKIHTYIGKFKYNQMHKFLSKFAVKPQPPTKDSTQSEPKPNAKPESTPIATLYNITTLSELESNCLSWNLCILSFISSSSDSEDSIQELNKFTDLLKNKSLQLPVAFIENATMATKLPQTFGVQNYPGMVVVSKKKKVYVPFLEPWEAERMVDFVQSVVRGGGGRPFVWSGKVEEGDIGMSNVHGDEAKSVKNKVEDMKEDEKLSSRHDEL